MIQAVLSRRAIFWQFLAGAMNGDGVAYHFLHRPHCTRDENTSAVPSPIKPLLPENPSFFPRRSQKISASMISILASGQTHSAVKPFVDPK